MAPRTEDEVSSRRIWVAIIAACSLAGAAKADLKLCNATPSRIGVALGYQDRKGWATEGWWNIPAEIPANVPAPRPINMNPS